jgi:predicted lipoprotein with Yx(FWY)xxD motif
MSTTRTRRNRDRAVAAVAAATGLALITSAMLLSTAGAVTAKTITVTQNKTWGPTLTMNGDTLYRLTKDSTNKSVCTGKCATVWLPVELAATSVRLPALRVCAKSRTKASRSTPSPATRRLAK